MRIALNPLQWYATQEGGLNMAGGPPLDAVLAEVAESGFPAVHAGVPATETSGEYAARLSRHGLRPAPGYFPFPSAEAGRRDELVAKASRAARLHAELGLGKIFVAAELVPERLTAPARSAGRAPDHRRLEAAAKAVERIAAAMAEHGVRACLHNHVGSPIESREELDFVLEATDPGLVGFGPDVGHLAWARADPAATIRRHRDRVGAVHLKDVRLDVAERGHRQRWDYERCVREGVWAEPGEGDVDLDAVLQAVGDFAGWIVMEVDRPTRPTPLESARVCWEWVCRNGLGG